MRIVTSLSARKKSFIALVIDLFCAVFCFWIAIMLRTGSFEDFSKFWGVFSGISSLVLLSIMWVRGVYEHSLRFFDRHVMVNILLSVGISAIVFFVFALMFKIEGIPRTLSLIFPLFFLFCALGWRFLVFLFLQKARATELISENALIFGLNAGSAIISSVVESQASYQILGFFSDDQSFGSRTVSGVPVFSIENLPPQALLDRVDVFIVGSRQALATFRSAVELDRGVRSIFLGSDLDSYGADPRSDVESSFASLFDRKRYEADSSLLARKNVDKRVLITGAGGSIGTELCLKILEARPSKLVAVDISESALFILLEKLRRRVNALALDEDLVVGRVGSINDEDFVFRLYKDLGPNSVYHAAAYKHVPLVEENIISAFKNNILGTKNLLEKSLDFGVKDFVLISSDKAVNPVNFMGVTKRICELLVQAFQAELAEQGSCYTIVRFGNVIGSSGSVLPLFLRQIREGVVTVTHPEVERFFMSISEAVELVLHASALSRGGEVFVLDMGEPIKIIDLAQGLITLCGHQIAERDTDSGIKIQFSGLRAGEKLKEDLWISDDIQETEHEGIFLANEPTISLKELSHVIEQCSVYVSQNDANSLRMKLMSIC